MFFFAVWLPFLNLSDTVGVSTFQLSPGDDESSASINIPNYFIFGNSEQSEVYVSLSVRFR